MSATILVSQAFVPCHAGKTPWLDVLVDNILNIQLCLWHLHAWVSTAMQFGKQTWISACIDTGLNTNKQAVRQLEEEGDYSCRCVLTSWVVMYKLSLPSCSCCTNCPNVMLTLRPLPKLSLLPDLCSTVTFAAPCSTQTNHCNQMSLQGWRSSVVQASIAILQQAKDSSWKCAKANWRLGQGRLAIMLLHNYSTTAPSTWLTAHVRLRGRMLYCRDARFTGYDKVRLAAWLIRTHLMVNEACNIVPVLFLML